MVFGMTQQSLAGQIIMLGIWVMLFYFLNKFLFFKALGSMEEVVELLQGYTKESARITRRVARKKGGSRTDPTPQIERMMEFFLIPPVSLDPYGILKKLEYMIDRAEDRFEQAAREISPTADRVWQANINSLLKGTFGLNMLTKIMRHFLESAKKTGSIFVAMPVLIQLPLIKKVAKAQLEGIRAISKGKPIGDGIGPLAAAGLLSGTMSSTPAKDVIYGTTKLADRTVHVLKAEGPGATLGKIGEATGKIAKKEKVKKIITIDASLKLEGEETGKVSEGIGAAIGDPGPEKSKIEEAAIELGIPLEAIVVKMSLEEAISPLTKNISSSVKNVHAFIEDSLKGMGRKEEALVVGVGNTCGIGNNREALAGLKFPRPKIEKEKMSRLDRLIKKLATPQKPTPEKRRKGRSKKDKGVSSGQRNPSRKTL